MPSSESNFASTFAALICWLTAYYFTERCLRFTTSYFNPRFYERLCASRKEPVFFGIAMGLLITVLFTPSCAYAAVDAYVKQSRIISDESWLWPLNQPLEWELPTHARVCVAARGVLWVSGLHALDMYGVYVLHYAGSILALLSWLHFRWPNLIFLTVFTTLVSEIPGDLLLLISSYRDTMEEVSPKLERFRTRMAWFHAVQHTLIRGGGLFIVGRMLWSNEPGVQDRPVAEQLYAYSMLGLYAACYASSVLRQRNTTRRQSPKAGISSPLPRTSGEKMAVPW